MRIDELRLTAFGPFTDVVLDLSAGREGFHLIYGANEAGKSSALRALRHLFYGIPLRSTDNFIHPHAKMRIGASLRTADGQKLSFVRRKGRLNTLRGADDETPLDEAPLQRLLSGIDADLFGTMFGIGYEDLVRGGQDILQGGGDVGRLVFSAGSGIANLREIQNRLQVDADLLFRPNGQKQLINEAIGRLNRLKKDLKAAQLPGSEWLRHDQALAAAMARKTVVQAGLDEKRKQLNRLRRIHRALPLIAGRKGILNDLSPLSDGVLLPEDFPENRRRILSQMAHVESQLRQAEETIGACTGGISELDVSAEVLDSGEIIEEIHLELGSQNKAVLDRVKLETLRAAAVSEAEAILRELPEELTPADAERLHIRKSEAERIRTLSVRHERIITRIEEAEKRLPDITADIRRIEGEQTALAEPCDVSALADTLLDSEPYGPREEPNRTEGAELACQSETLGLLCNQLGIGEATLDDLEHFRVVPSETIRIFEERLDAQDRRILEIRTGLQKTRSALDEVGSRLDTLQLTFEVPTEANLTEIRELRDTGWRLIAMILAGDAVPKPSIDAYIANIPETVSLSQAFETALYQADATCDRLRREADRVAAKAQLLAEQTALTHQLQVLEKDFDAAENAKSQTLQSWQGHWQEAGVPCQSPREMAQWAQEFRALVERVQAFRTRKARFEELSQRIEEHRTGLARILGQVDPAEAPASLSLAGLIKKAHGFIERQEDLNRQREQLLRDQRMLLHELQATRERIQSGHDELGDWTRQWEAALRPIGLSAEALPETAEAVMAALQQRFEKLKEARILQKRIEGIDRDAEVFRREVTAVSEVVAPDLAQRPATEAALALHHRLKRSRESWTQRQSLEKQLTKARERRRQADQEMAELSGLLREMCREARCDSSDQLPEAELRSQRRRKLEADLAATDEQLRLLSGGAGVEDFIGEALMVDPDGMEATIRELEETVEALERDTSALDQTIGSERAELDRMDGGVGAAELSAEIQTTLGAIETHVETYVRLKMAAKVLSLAIERYRSRSQGPTLHLASRRFTRITGGAFEGLRAEYDESGRPVLVGIRPDGQTLHVEAMSDGTADQLYLALRLAGLEMYLAQNEPIPFIVDDILIQFDDERAGATLGTLAELSEKTQLIFFTHHRHLVEIAQRCIPQGQLFHHTL
jgi:uncharacterized protein YhaN